MINVIKVSIVAVFLVALVAFDKSEQKLGVKAESHAVAVVSHS